MADLKVNGSDTNMDRERADINARRLEYIGELIRQSDNPRASEVLSQLLQGTLEGVEERFLAYRDKLVSSTEDWQLEKMKKIITNIEKNSHERLVRRQPSIARKCTVSQLHTDALRNCIPSLSSDLDLQGSRLVDDLISAEVLSVSDRESVRGKGSRRTQVEELITCLMGRVSQEQFHHVLLPALEKDYPHLTSQLLAEVDRLEEENEEKLCVACRIRSTVQVKRLATPLLMSKSISIAVHSDLRNPGLTNSAKWAELRSVPDSDIVAAMKKKYPAFHADLAASGEISLACRCKADVNKRNSQTIMAALGGQVDLLEKSEMTRGTTVYDLDVCLNFDDEDLEHGYKMTARPKGICLIINNTDITGHIKRTWSNNDAQRLYLLFEKMEFIVVTKNNLKTSEMEQTMQEYAEFNHTKFDAFVCCVLTYGDNEEICGSDGRFIKTSTLTSKLTASACPTLAGKPKLFFFTGNRGKSHMGGHRYSPSDRQPYSKYIADEADFFVGHATSPGFKSFWHNTEGSDYISVLTRVLDTESDRHDLLTCMMMVNHEVSRRNMLHGNVLYKQVPAPVFTLTKNVFLTSDPLWPNDL